MCLFAELAHDTWPQIWPCRVNGQKSNLVICSGPGWKAVVCGVGIGGWAGGVSWTAAGGEVDRTVVSGGVDWGVAGEVGRAAIIGERGCTVIPGESGWVVITREVGWTAAGGWMSGDSAEGRLGLGREEREGVVEYWELSGDDRSSESKSG